MKRFGERETVAATDWAAEGGQALSTQAGEHPSTGHLFDQDLVRLRETAKRFGLRGTPRVEHQGTRYQHVLLVNEPLAKAVAACAAEGQP